MNLTDKVTIPAHVMARQVGDETVILDLVSGTYFGLDPIGARIWQLMGDGKSLAEIRDAVLDEYDVTREAVEEDLVKLAEELLSLKLIAL